MFIWLTSNPQVLVSRFEFTTLWHFSSRFCFHRKCFEINIISKPLIQRSPKRVETSLKQVFSEIWKKEYLFLSTFGIKIKTNLPTCFHMFLLDMFSVFIYLILLMVLILSMRITLYGIVEVFNPLQTKLCIWNVSLLEILKQ